MATPSATAHTLSDVARRLAPRLRIISASQPTPALRTHNVIGVADTPELGREAILALESVEQSNDVGTVIMGAIEAASPNEPPGVDPEGVTRQLAPRILIGAVLGAIVGAIVIGAGALILGARGWEIVGAAAAGAMLVSVFGIIWVSFAGMGGSDAYRQTFVDENVDHLTLVSLHTDEPGEAAAARDELRKAKLRVFEVDRFGHISSGR